MKLSTIACTIFTTAALAAPTESKKPAGPYDNIDWTKIDYPKGTGENLESYPAPPGGWENVKYPELGDCLKEQYDDKKPKSPFVFTSSYSVTAVGDEVRNATAAVPGSKDAKGYFNYGINSATDTICYVSTKLPSLLSTL
jgi:hypothetical protein